jgi:1-acyl-sn-glycerol-3-phosphate acyltransferase
MWACLQGVGKFLARLLRIPMTLHGGEYLPRECPCILVSNHASYLDSFVLTALLPFPVRFVAKAELAGSMWLRLFLNRLGTEFVDRFDMQQGIEDARRIGGIARSGQPLVFFAEGTFTRMPGLLPFHMGAFVAAAEAGVAVVPLAIRGTRSLLRSESWFFRRGGVTVTIGSPLETLHIREKHKGDTWAAAVELRDAAREHILRHSGEPDLAHEKSPI